MSKDSTESTIDEVNSIKHSATSNRMTLNLLKTWKMLIYSKTTKPDPPPVPGSERKKLAQVARYYILRKPLLLGPPF